MNHYTLPLSPYVHHIFTIFSPLNHHFFTIKSSLITIKSWFSYAFMGPLCPRLLECCHAGDSLDSPIFSAAGLAGSPREVTGGSRVKTWLWMVNPIHMYIYIYIYHIDTTQFICILVYVYIYTPLLIGGDWNMTFNFPYSQNNHPNWLSYFSEGSKPPTRSPVS